MKCYCRTLGRKFCPLHHPRSEGTVGRVRTTPFNSTHQIKSNMSGSTLIYKSRTDHPHVTSFTYKDMAWTLEEINNMDVEELWAALTILRIPEKHPSEIHPQVEKVDMIRHLKAHLEIYSEKSMEKYYSEYPFMRGSVGK